MTPSRKLVPQIHRRFRKLVMTLTKDSSFILNYVYNSLRRKYNVKYIGLFRTESDLKMYVQLGTNCQMSPSSLKKKMISIIEVKGYSIEVKGYPETFVNMEGTLLESFGEFSKIGRKFGSKVDNGKMVTPPKKKTSPKKIYPMYAGHGGVWGVCGYIVSDDPTVRKDATKAERLCLLKEQENKCVYCKCPVYFGKASNADVDHIIPLSLGGDTSIDNMQVLCVQCHRRKTGLEFGKKSISQKNLVVFQRI